MVNDYVGTSASSPVSSVESIFLAHDGIQSYEDRISNTEYARIVDGILEKAKQMPNHGNQAYHSYTKCKRMHHDQIGFLWGDPRYDKFIDDLSAILRI